MTHPGHSIKDGMKEHVVRCHNFKALGFTGLDGGYVCYIEVAKHKRPIQLHLQVCHTNRSPFLYTTRTLSSRLEKLATSCGAKLQIPYNAIAAHLPYASKVQTSQHYVKGEVH